MNHPTKSSVPLNSLSHESQGGDKPPTSDCRWIMLALPHKINDEQILCACKAISHLTVTYLPAL